MTSVEYIGRDGQIHLAEVEPGVINSAAHRVYRLGQCHALAIVLARRLDWDVMISAAHPKALLCNSNVSVDGMIKFDHVDYTSDQGGKAAPIELLVEHFGLRPERLQHAIAVSPDGKWMLDLVGLREYHTEAMASRRWSRQISAQVAAEDLMSYVSTTDRPRLDFELAESFVEGLVSRAGL